MSLRIPSSRMCLALLCLGMGGGVANAAPTAAEQQAIRSSCQSDYRAYCASVPTGGAAALQCLEKNLASLSPSCQEAVQAVGGASGATPVAPAAPATEAAPATTAAPVQAQPDVIVIEPGQAIALMRQACGADYRAHCAGVRIIGGGALACLVSHGASLSPSCKGELSRLGQRF